MFYNECNVMDFDTVFLCTCLFYDRHSVSVSFKLPDFVVLSTQVLKHFHKKYYRSNAK